MYEDTYEEYIRSILGYPSQNMYVNSMPNAYVSSNVAFANREIEKYYPEIYNELYPKIKNECNSLKATPTEEQIDKMIDQIYNDFENSRSQKVNATTLKQENREENRNSRNNSVLRDLIKILILRELLGNSRPPMSNPRPPFRSNFPMEPRPPIMPRN